METEELVRLDGAPTEYSDCACGRRIVRVDGDYWGTVETGGREIISANHKHAPILAQATSSRGHQMEEAMSDDNVTIPEESEPKEEEKQVEEPAPPPIPEPHPAIPSYYRIG